MPNRQQELFFYARTLSVAGQEDLHVKLLSRRSKIRKELILKFDELLDAAVEERLVRVLRESRSSVRNRRSNAEKAAKGRLMTHGDARGSDEKVA